MGHAEPEKAEPGPERAEPEQERAERCSTDGFQRGPGAPLRPARLLAERIASVNARIEAACRRAHRSSAEITMMVVTKTCGPQILPELAAAGLTQWGENRLDHLQDMAREAPAAGRFHYIGRVQGRQFAKLLPFCSSIHSLCGPGHPQRLDAACAQLQRTELPVHIQVDTAADGRKAGVAPEDLPAYLESCATCTHLRVVGLMTMAPDLRQEGDESRVRRCFAGLRELARLHGLGSLSMGMSQDFEIAVEEGATVLRLGSILVGHGPAP